MVFCVSCQCLLLHLPSSPIEGKTWKDAQSICSSFESSLVIIDSEIEQGRKSCTTTCDGTFHLKKSPPEKNTVCTLLSNSVGRHVRKKLLCYFLWCHLCSIYHYAAPGKCSRCLDWFTRGHRKMDRLQQLVTNKTRELSHRKYLLFWACFCIVDGMAEKHLWRPARDLKGLYSVNKVWVCNGCNMQ